MEAMPGAVKNWIRRELAHSRHGDIARPDAIRITPSGVLALRASCARGLRWTRVVRWRPPTWEDHASPPRETPRAPARRRRRRSGAASDRRDARSVGVTAVVPSTHAPRRRAVVRPGDGDGLAEERAIVVAPRGLDEDMPTMTIAGLGDGLRRSRDPLEFSRETRPK